MAQKYLDQWEVPSESELGKTYKVTQYEDGMWKCSCPRWIFTLQKKGEDCKHIKAVKAGEFKPGLHLPILVGNCQQVELKDGHFLHPMIPVGWPETTDFVYTQLYDLATMGESWGDIREAFKVIFKQGFPSKTDVFQRVESRGRCILGEWVDKVGYNGFVYMEVEHERSRMG